MALVIDIPYRKDLSTKKSLKEVASFFSDPSVCIVPHFPGLESLTPQGNSFRWEFEKLRYSGYELKIQFETTMEKGPHFLEIKPTNREGHKLSGNWKFEPEGTGTVIHFDMKITLELPVPSLMKSVVQPLAQRELTKLVEKFTDNIGHALA